MTAAKLAELASDSDSALESARAPAQESLDIKSADAFRTIGEAASELGLKTHVLRFWETKFDNLRPLKRPDGRRYYRAEDMEVLRRLQNLLHVQGLTIRGAIKALDSDTADAPVDVPVDVSVSAEAGSEDGAEDMAVPADTGISVRDLQDAVRDAVERGDFREQAIRDNIAARARLESLLEDLSNLKSRLDAVRTAA